MPRIIPCLDVRHGRVVKGVHFENLVDSGDPVELAARYDQEGADELVWLDIVATVEDLALSLSLIQQARDQLAIPLTVGGGIRSIGHVEDLLAHGADKVSINSYALIHPDIITQIADRWGSQCVVVAVDAKREGDHFQVYSHGGRQRTPYELGEWLREAEDRGAGEFLLTSMDKDGTQTGYDLAMLAYARTMVQRPVIASGGAGSITHIEEALTQGNQAVLLASILHQERLSIADIKRTLLTKGVTVRWP
ncbi:1-(5-phosphoribosyl)-5-((5-phosphoribosylamino) methylideneamino)imidazole-4-carboxamideisomerase [Sulfobacillus acidophilus DSM 10332]|uniref:Imidazole glycerol phosphate synthase subunit HisF n=1 Tax=Sulfobacillus acidophilus (strain ATCC 700253 / DSM 10332 / NAL) TaxID=679936 RepID=G8TXZ4_SULAD|nr:1-(5-phosphoribosyl)-5-((5-phosphoribosylamino) methylideneamino)imidazole-4-carboxamideisomerase [Sulfobacillus acidophilus DSM 10332]